MFGHKWRMSDNQNSKNCRPYGCTVISATDVWGFGRHVGPVMLSLKTLSCFCLKIVFAISCRLGLVLANFVLEFTHTATKEGFPKIT